MFGFFDIFIRKSTYHNNQLILGTTISVPNKTLLMAGDSATDSGRYRPIGIGTNTLDNGYVPCLAQLLINHNKENEITLKNMGVSENTIKDLRSRWKNDVLDLNPDWISILYSEPTPVLK